jgi:hypothetical protein
MRHPAGGLKASQRIEITAGETLKLEIRVSPEDRVD